MDGQSKIYKTDKQKDAMNDKDLSAHQGGAITNSEQTRTSSKFLSRSIIPVILCGGVGSRLWPVSRDLHPKPFIRLSDGQSLLQKAFLRGAQLPGVAEILTVTNRDLFFKTKDEYCEVNASGLPLSFILEPFGRNTAAAIAAATLQVSAAHGSDAIMLVLAADHLIADHTAFQQAVAEASGLASTGNLVTFGIQPHGPETGYGYIEADGNAVLRFVEKPCLDKAKEYLASGRFFWNSGMFCFTSGAMLHQLEEQCPDILSATRACMEQSRSTAGQGFAQVELDPDLFSKVPDNSIDYAVMEKTHNALVVACDIGWSDIGCWKALGDLTTPDDNNNRVQGCALVVDSKNCTIKSENRVVGAVGVENLIIIDTADALLVVDNRRTQEVKHLYAQLQAQGHEAHKLHRTVYRPWGTYTVLEEGPNFKIKRIEIKSGASISLQMHHHRSEHWVVVMGIAKVLNGDNELILRANESTFIPAQHKHRLENIGTGKLVIIEVQTGGYLGEDDIVRFEDAYGRTP
ncbi:mannose-1-phosphate guanylyltransferase/mannose-6-phosphate isomerase [Nitrospina watsonii]|uniref:mannose-1-phosphate guanylyltransferase/mannose-6-phosphate isomerase n=1 Tax=Nitrospina watsonii TaxID=1323948 RepID=UPI0024909C43|nr:mannose-1-phosphate guanylyltransferase/mannose-6-phosphate isomerase [Nitrospina watsonii]